jgi:hypothetical protein
MRKLSNSISRGSKPEDRFMSIAWKTAAFAFVGLGAVAAMGLNGNADDNGLFARSVEVPAVDCNFGDPLISCFDPRWGFPAQDLFIWDPR